MYTRIIIISLFEDYDDRLSQLNIEDMNVHFNAMCSRYKPNVRSCEDHVCNDLSQLPDNGGQTFFSDKLLHTQVNSLSILRGKTYKHSLGLLIFTFYAGINDRDIQRSHTGPAYQRL